MFLQDILEVAIGLMFTWLVISIATMSIQEWINKLFDKRAIDLEVAIGKMLADPNLTAQFYNHPAIFGGLEQKKVNRGKGKNKIAVTKRPEWIPAQLFAQVLFDIVRTAGTEASLLQQGLSGIKEELIKIDKKDKKMAAREGLDALLDLARQAAATDAGQKFTTEALKKLREKINEYSAAYPDYKPAIDEVLAKVEEQKKEIELAYKETKFKENALRDLRRGVVALTVLSPRLKQTLSTLLEGVEKYVKEGENDLALARQNVENWFNASMDRLTETFKRYAKNMSFLIGLGLALILNVDAIALATQLWREPTVRQALVAVSDQFITENPEGVEIPEGGVDPKTAVQNFRENFSGLNIPVGWSFKKITDATCKLFPQENEEFGFTIKGICYQPANATRSTNFVFWFLVKLAGIGITGLATLQGAPFWFDLLRSLLNMRGSVAKTEDK